MVSGGAASIDEKVGHTAQGFDPVRHSPVRQGDLQLVEQVFKGGGGFRTHDIVLARSVE
jgi:hypothetical protein